MTFDFHPILTWFRQFDPAAATSIVMFSILGGMALVALFHSMLLNPNKKDRW